MYNLHLIRFEPLIGVVDKLHEEWQSPGLAVALSHNIQELREQLCSALPDVYLRGG